MTDDAKHLKMRIIEITERVSDWRERAEKAEAECKRLRQAIADAANAVPVVKQDILAKVDYEMLLYRENLRRVLKEPSK